MSSFGEFVVPTPQNEPVAGFLPGSPERASLQAALKAQRSERTEMFPVIGGERVRTESSGTQVMPHDHQHVLGDVHLCQAPEVEMAISAAREAAPDWAAMDFCDRAAIMLKAADLLAGPHRDRVNAATMDNQSKTCHQAEIDAACELIDFFRFNVAFAQKIYAEQPASSPGMWNRLEHRPLEGFVFCVTPFNFTSIAGNLPTAPALMGNTVLWKPASSSILSGYRIMELLEEAGMPPGVINFLPGRGGNVGDTALASPELAGVHFTGSTGVFNGMWGSIGANVDNYRAYPRLVGETGGKDFIFAHPSSQVESLVTALLRGAFEYQGQKCSAASRAYIPASLWGAVKQQLLDNVATIKMGDPADFTNFMGAVIDKGAFRSISGYIDYAKESSDAEILIGGGCDDSSGYFIEPTVVQTSDPSFKLMREEIFGPVLTLYVYEDAELDQALDSCDSASPYALTGAIFGQDRAALAKMGARLRNTAGNFYINDKPSGAVVGQQPFGGARASGTNDKAGSYLNLLRWVSPRTIKETFVPPTDYRYGFLQAD